MTHLIAIAGSPTLDSKSTQLLQTALVSTKQQDFTGKLFSVRDVPAHDLFYGAGEDNPDLNKIIDQQEQSSGVIIATYLQGHLFTRPLIPGGAKSLIGFAVAKSPGWKSRIAITTGGSQKHLLAIDYELKPVLYALSATYVLSGLYVWTMGSTLQ